MLCTALLVAGCAGGGALSSPPPTPESCPPGEQLVCTGGKASKLRKPQDMICRCDPFTGRDD